MEDDSGQRQESRRVVEFLKDEHVRRLLSKPSNVFAPPSDASKKDFETKTAPINVTSASNTRHDIESIKEDAEWLSRNANINSVAALRLVVIEFQSRPHRQLLGPLSSQDAANLKEAAGLDNGQGSGLVSDTAGGTPLDAEEISAQFEQDSSRKRRLFTTYLSERCYFMLAADYANTIRLYERLPIYASMHENPAHLYNLKSSSSQVDELDFLMSNYLQIVTDAMGRIERGINSVTDDALLLTDELEMEWIKTSLTEVVHALSVILQAADKFGHNFAPSSIVNQWFALMEIYTFFAPIQAVRPPFF